MPRPFLAALLLPLLAACATTEPVVAAPAGEGGCDADAARGVVGEIATADVVERARRAAGAQVARTLKPGQMVTMEYHASRLNIDVDAGNRITNVRCG
jgi:hypothetical protein